MPELSGERLQRFARQLRLAELGTAGQERLAAARVVVLGCGATGGAAALLLARAGVGSLRLVDRDLVERANLPRQLLFDESHLEPPQPKAIAAAQVLARGDSSLVIEPVVADVSSDNVRALLAGADLVVDGSDNFQLRYLLNDACIEQGIAWVYQAAVGVIAQTALVVPDRTPCLACWLPEPPPAEQVERCDTAGVLGVAVVAVASLAAAAALRWLAAGEPGRPVLHTMDLWDLRCGELPLARRADCRACACRDLVYLRGEAGGEAVRVCGRNAVQIAAPAAPPSLAHVAATLERLADPMTTVRATPHLLTVRRGAFTVHLFADGRAIVEGTSEPAEARRLAQELTGS